MWHLIHFHKMTNWKSSVFAFWFFFPFTRLLFLALFTISLRKTACKNFREECRTCPCLGLLMFLYFFVSLFVYFCFFLFFVSCQNEDCIFQQVYKEVLRTLTLTKARIHKYTHTRRWKRKKWIEIEKTRSQIRKNNDRDKRKRKQRIKFMYTMTFMHRCATRKRFFVLISSHSLSSLSLHLFSISYLILYLKIKNKLRWYFLLSVGMNGCCFWWLSIKSNYIELLVWLQQMNFVLHVKWIKMNSSKNKIESVEN